MAFLGLFKKKPRVYGLALGAGSARGMAHAGILKVLQREKIPISVVVGTSAGALVGGLFAAGLPMTTLVEKLDKLGIRIWTKYFLPTFPHGALIDGTRIYDFATEFVGDILIENLPITYAAVATDIQSGQEVIIRKGSLAEAIRASSAIPGMFTPSQQAGRYLADGGLVNPVPVDTCRALGADFVIAVNVNPRVSIAAKEITVQPQGHSKEGAGADKSKITKKKLIEKIQNIDLGLIGKDKLLQWLLEQDKTKIQKSPYNIFEVLVQAVSIVYARSLYARSRQAEPDFILEPGTASFAGMDYDHYRELFDIGEQYAQNELVQLKKSMGLF